MKTGAKSLLLVMLLLVCSISFVQSGPPAQQFVSDQRGLAIQYPSYDYLAKDKAFKLRTHVFNQSDGKLMPNTDTTCTVQLYDSQGSHVLKSDMDYEEPEFELTISAGNFSSRGAGAYIIFCNNSYSGGFVSGNFHINDMGIDPDETTSIFVYSLLFAAALMFVMQFAFNNEYLVIKTLFLFLSIGFLLIGINAAAVVSSNYEVIRDLGNVAMTMAIVLLGLFLLYVFIYSFKKTIQIFEDKGDIRWGDKEKD